MAISYSWSVGDLDVQYSSASLTDVVTTIHWEYSGKLETTSSIGVSGSFGGSCVGKVGLGSVAPSAFVAYGSLTKPLVLGWVTGSLGNANITQMQTNISKSITVRLNPTVGPKGGPWLPRGSLETGSL